METLFFSIVIPTLNEEKYIPRLLKTIAMQGFKKYEVFVVDGGSTDKTIAKVHQFEDKIPLHLVNADKKNVGYQRNLGATKATGTYLIFLDADAFLPRGFFTKLSKKLLNDNPPLATTLYSPDSKKYSGELYVFLLNLGLEIAKYIEHPQALGVSLVIKRTLFKTLGGFKEKLKIAEDHELVQRAHKKGYDITIYKDPRVYLSLRRIRAEGTLTMVMRYTYAYFYCTFKGPITKELFPYEMGGHVYASRVKKDFLKIPKTSFDDIYRLARDNKVIEKMRDRFKHI